MFRKVGTFLRNDWQHTKNHLFGFGKGAKWVRKGKRFAREFGLDPNNLSLNAQEILAWENPTMSAGELNRISRKINNFIGSEQNWKDTKDVLFSELGDKYRSAKDGLSRAWDGTKSGVSRAWDSTQGVRDSIKRKTVETGHKIKKGGSATASGLATTAGVVGLGGLGLVNYTND